MKKWFNQLNLTNSILICCFLVIGGISLILLRINKLTPFGFGIGFILVIEAIVLSYKKYLGDK